MLKRTILLVSFFIFPKLASCVVIEYGGEKARVSEGRLWVIAAGTISPSICLPGYLRPGVSVTLDPGAEYSYYTEAPDGKVMYLQGILASASSYLKMELWIGPKGNETFLFATFNSISSPLASVWFPFELRVPLGFVVLIRLKNLSEKSFTIYSTICYRIDER
jgi:hypothetical protein